MSYKAKIKYKLCEKINDGNGGYRLNEVNFSQSLSSNNYIHNSFDSVDELIEKMQPLLGRNKYFSHPNTVDSYVITTEIKFNN